jgi:hypothetical protein
MASIWTNTYCEPLTRFNTYVHEKEEYEEIRGEKVNGACGLLTAEDGRHTDRKNNAFAGRVADRIAYSDVATRWIQRSATHRGSQRWRHGHGRRLAEASIKQTDLRSPARNVFTITRSNLQILRLRAGFPSVRASALDCGSDLGRACYGCFEGLVGV